MQRIMGVILFLFSVITASPQNKINFDEYFVDKTLRVDYYQIGDSKEEKITIDRLVGLEGWAGPKTNLIYPFDYGRYRVSIFDVADNGLIYTSAFDCMFGEYKTTDPALKGVQRTFNRSINLPMPKKPARLVIEKTDRENIPQPLFIQQIDPNDYHILAEPVKQNDLIIEILKNGDPHTHVDMALIGEGYTNDEKEKFKTDATKYADYLFEFEPYQSKKTDFNIYAVFSPSAQSGVDEPRERSYRQTTLNASFNAFDLDRYLLTEDGIPMRRVAAQVPYDAIIILVNSKRYGGGGIFNDYAITSVDNERSKMVFLHEFGHSFGGLADEYYTSDLAYNDFYPKGIEPTEPNITALLDPQRVKWRELVSPEIGIPTEYGKDQRDSLTVLRQQNNKKRDQEIVLATKAGKSEKEINRIKERYKELDKKNEQQLNALKTRYKDLEDKVGVFEGAGYSTKGLYRPMIYCLMISHPKNELCLVCQNAVKKMIDYYCGREIR